MQRRSESVSEVTVQRRSRVIGQCQSNRTASEWSEVAVQRRSESVLEVTVQRHSRVNVQHRSRVIVQRWSRVKVTRHARHSESRMQRAWGRSPRDDPQGQGPTLRHASCSVSQTSVLESLS